MATCCRTRCSCAIVAGPNVTVVGTGNASQGTPYIISATPVPPFVAAQDSPTVATTLTGAGTAASPYTVSSAVILDPTPPGGGTNLVHSGPDGLYVECADVRGCISAGDGAAYDPATGIITAHLSTTAGNTVAIGPDGGLLVPAVAPTPTVIQAGDSPSVDNTVTGAGTVADPYVVTSAAVLDVAPPGGGSNLVHAGPDGLYVECADVRGCISAGDGAAYDPATGVITAHLSSTAGNTVAIGPDGGLLVPAAAPTPLTVTDSPSVDLTLSGAGTAASPYAVAAAVVLDATPPGGGTNLVHSGADGLYVECADVRGCISAGDGAAYDPATGIITAHLSGNAGNAVAIGTDGGLFVPAGGTSLAAQDSPTVDVGVSGTGTVADPYEVTAAVVLDPTPPGGGTNLVHSGPDGLYVECADVRGCISAGDGATYNPATGVVSAHLSTTAGNTVSIGGDGGLLVPAAAPTPLTVTDSTTVDLTLTGAGTAASPYAVTGAVILDPTPPGGGTNLIGTGPQGLFLECADIRGCISAGNGAAYTAGTGVVAARLSTDVGNNVKFGADGGLFASPVTGCGLDGAGTAADPLIVVPSAGSAAWAWPCAVATHSGTKCDPATGKIWSPPEHYSAEDHIYVEHFNGGIATPITNTGGWAVIDPGANQNFSIPANFIGNNCRTWGFIITASGTWDINYTNTAAFQLGYVEVKNGGPATVRALWGPITTLGAARRSRDNGTVTESGWNIAPTAGYSVVLYPAINVTAGSVTINSWITDATIITTTNTP